MTMKELVEASGLHRQTIHFYLREGLLPPACAAAGTRNARYGEQHLSLLRLLRELRDRRGLSLPAIQRLFEQAAFQPAEIQRALLSLPPAALDAGAASALWTTAELKERTGASDDLWEVLVATGAIAPDADDPAGRFGADLAPIVEGALRLAEQGIGREALQRLLELAGAMANIEVTTLLEDAGEALGGAEQLSRRAEARHRAISELAGGVRGAALREMLRRLAEVGPRARRFAEEAIYVPSALFIRRHRLDRTLAETEAAAQGSPQDGGAGLRLGRLLLGLGRYEEAEVWLARAEQRAPQDAGILSYLGLARTLGGRVLTGVACCRGAVKRSPRSARSHAFLGSALGVQAALTGGLHSPELLRQALQAAGESRACSEQDLRERLEVLIARGRLLTVLPVGAAGYAEGIGDLNEVLQHTGRRLGEDEGFDFPGMAELYRIHALYYLGAAPQTDPERALAAQRLRECITLDPQSRFARQAYERLAELES